MYNTWTLKGCPNKDLHGNKFWNFGDNVKIKFARRSMKSQRRMTIKEIENEMLENQTFIEKHWNRKLTAQIKT